MTVTTTVEMTLRIRVTEDHETIEEANQWASIVGPDEALSEGVLLDTERNVVEQFVDDEGDDEEEDDGANAQS
jgi:hypothetical protein